MVDGYRHYSCRKGFRCPRKLYRFFHPLSGCAPPPPPHHPPHPELDWRHVLKYGQWASFPVLPHKEPIVPSFREFPSSEEISLVKIEIFYPFKSSSFSFPLVFPCSLPFSLFCGDEFERIERKVTVMEIDEG